MASDSNGLAGLLAGYRHDGFFCEMMGPPGGEPVEAALALLARLDRLPLARLRERALDAERELYNLGITFTVYTQKDRKSVV